MNLAFFSCELGTNSKAIVTTLIFSLLLVNNALAGSSPVESSNLKRMNFVKIKPGSFIMGSPLSEPDRGNDEIPHRVTLTQEFEIQTTPVTQAQWVQVLGSNPSRHQEARFCPQTFVEKNGIAMCPNNPVEEVDYGDVQRFISKLNSTQSNGYYYRLPTEAEWEFAARAGTSTPYFFGNNPNFLVQYAWYYDNSSGYQTHEVAKLKPNAYGLYDIYGNVSQWVADWHSAYDLTSAIDPFGPTRSHSPFSERVVRGGSYGEYEVQNLRSAARSRSRPGVSQAGLGFRLVRTR